MTGFALKDLQKWMQSALIAPEGAFAATRLSDSPRLTAAEGLAIYQRSYALRIAACMREQFPTLCHALGTDLFNDFVAEYIREAPPESYTLYDLGRRFPGFLQKNRTDSGADTPEPWFDFMVDLAQFERLVFTVFDSAGSEDMQLATATTPESALQVQPSLRIAQHRYPVAWYYHQIRDGQSPDIPQKEQCCVAVLRKNFQTTTFPVAPAHAVFLQAMCDGADVDKALCTVAQTYGHSYDDVATSWKNTPELLEGWKAAGIFVDTRADIHTQSS